jgi:hypothetical protein
VKRGVTLSALVIFVIRAILGIIFAILLTRLFYPNAPIIGTAGFAAGLVGLAYITEHFRNRKKRP